RLGVPRSPRSPSMLGTRARANSVASTRGSSAYRRARIFQRANAERKTPTPSRAHKKTTAPSGRRHKRAQLDANEAGDLSPASFVDRAALYLPNAKSFALRSPSPRLE